MRTLLLANDTVGLEIAEFLLTRYRDDVAAVVTTDDDDISALARAHTSGENLRARLKMNHLISIGSSMLDCLPDTDPVTLRALDEQRAPFETVAKGFARLLRNPPQHEIFFNAIKDLTSP